MIRAPHCVNTRDSQVLHSYKLLILSKTYFSRLHKIINTNQTQSMNDTVFVLESPQAWFHERFLASHVSKIGGNTTTPYSSSVDKTVHGLQQPNADDAAIATFETTRELVRRTSRKLVALTQFCKRHRRCRPHVARPKLPEEMHTSR